LDTAYKQPFLAEELPETCWNFLWKTEVQTWINFAPSP